MTIHDILREAGEKILLRDAELLLAHIVDQERVWLFAHSDSEVSRTDADDFRRLLHRRLMGEPLQYLLGAQEFFGLKLEVGPDVLIPRPETEQLVEAVLGWAGGVERPLRIVDVGTGSGAIALALAKHLPDVELFATDISLRALAVAVRNASALSLADKITFLHSDLLAALALAGLDAVVSNPPYVPSGDAATMQREVVEHEPHEALFAGEDGLAVYKKLLPQAHAALRPGGLLAMEFGFGQKVQLEELLATWRNLRFFDDYAGIPRIVLANRV